jgi:uncharacterized protein YggL (DUF469 family)
MSNAKAKQLTETIECQSSYAVEEFQKFIDRHLAEGEHNVQLYLDGNGNCYAIFCTICDPKMADVTETRH